LKDLSKRFSSFSKTSKPSQDIISTIEASSLTSKIKTGLLVSKRLTTAKTTFDSYRKRLVSMKEGIDSMYSIATQSSGNLPRSERVANESIFLEVQNRVKDISTRLVNDNIDLYQATRITRTKKGQLAYAG